MEGNRRPYPGNKFKRASKMNFVHRGNCATLYRQQKIVLKNGFTCERLTRGLCLNESTLNFPVGTISLLVTQHCVIVLARNLHDKTKTVYVIPLLILFHFCWPLRSFSLKILCYLRPVLLLIRVSLSSVSFEMKIVCVLSIGTGKELGGYA